MKTRFAQSAGAYALALQPDGKIVAAGHIAFQRFALVRYEPDGALDATFSRDGKKTTTFAEGFATGNAMVVQQDGKIVVAGHVDFRSFALARYRASGSLDATFGGDGRITTNASAGNDSANGIALQPDGKIVAAGYASARGGRFVVARYLAD